jgi:hypothetical protein
MSKKTLRKKWKGGEIYEKGTYWDVGKLLKRYMQKRTTKRKYPIKLED